MVFISVLVFATPSKAYSATALKQNKGTMSAGGFLTLPIEWDPVRGTSLLINFSPQFGISLFDGFELHANAILKSPILSQTSMFGDRSSQWFWGLGLGIKYSFDTSWPVIPYVGFDLNYSMAKLIATTASTSIELPIGIMVPLNRHVALTFGVKTSVMIVAQIKVFDKLRFEPGYLGINAYF